MCYIVCFRALLTAAKLPEARRLELEEIVRDYYGTTTVHHNEQLLKSASHLDSRYGTNFGLLLGNPATVTMALCP